ncbi:hypothetical protein Hanom_Chr04g00316661 [Helianthus anomalus]
MSKDDSVNEQIKENLLTRLHLLTYQKNILLQITTLKEVKGFFEDKLEELVGDRLEAISEKKVSESDYIKVLVAELEEKRLKELVGELVEENKDAEISALKEELSRLDNEIRETQRTYDSIASEP